MEVLKSVNENRYYQPLVYTLIVSVRIFLKLCDTEGIYKNTKYKRLIIALESFDKFIGFHKNTKIYIGTWLGK